MWAMYSCGPNTSNHDFLVLVMDNIQNCFVLIASTSIFLILYQIFLPSISLASYFLYCLLPMVLDKNNQSRTFVPPGFLVQYRREAPGHRCSCQYRMVHLLSRWFLWENMFFVNDDSWGRHGN